VDDEAAAAVAKNMVESGHWYLVTKGGRHTPNHGIHCRRSKSMIDQDRLKDAVYGSLVRGEETGDGWLKVADCYLPMYIDGVLSLVRQPDKEPFTTSTATTTVCMDTPKFANLAPPDAEYYLENVLHSFQTGIWCRRSKNNADIDKTQAVHYKTYIRGHDAGDGWLQLDSNCFLPFAYNGTTIITRVSKNCEAGGMNANETADQAGTVPPANCCPTGTKFICCCAPAFDCDCGEGYDFGPNGCARNQCGGQYDGACVPLESKPEPREAEVEQSYLVDSFYTKSSAQGLLCRRTKHIDDVDFNRETLYNSIVTGVDDGDGWLRVGDCLLPFTLRGKPVLILNGKPRTAHSSALQHFLVTNSFTKSKHKGMICRKSANIDDKDESGQHILFGKVVGGVDETNGWVKLVGQEKVCYLPKLLSGQPALLLQPEKDEPAGKSRNLLKDSAAASVSSSSRDAPIHHEPQDQALPNPYSGGRQLQASEPSAA
jgi:hypothetical protein